MTDRFDTEQTNIELNIEPNGLVKGTYRINKYDYAAIKERQKISGSSSIADYQKSLQNKSTSITIDSLQVNNLNELSEPLEIQFKFNWQEEDAAGAKTIYLQPFIIDKMESNPLKQFIRIFPVDFGVKKRSIVNTTINIPDGFEVESITPSTNFTLPDKSGFFKILTKIEGNKINIQTLLQLSNTIYSSGDYKALKELFSLMIKTQSDPIVLKKKATTTSKTK
ncbi:hypothetical protein D3C80_1492790 [compost metagenome]